MRGLVTAVSSGDYSDYTVHCLFEREEDAIAYLDKTAVRETYKFTSGACLAWHEKGKPYGTVFYLETFQFWSAGQVPTLKRVEDKKQVAWKKTEKLRAGLL